MTEYDIQKLFKIIPDIKNKILQNDQEILDCIKLCIENTQRYYDSIWKETLEEIQYNIALNKDISNLSVKNQRYYEGKLAGLQLSETIMIEHKGELSDE